jgi:hypothetical protein
LTLGLREPLHLPHVRCRRHLLLKSLVPTVGLAMCLFLLVRRRPVQAREVHGTLLPQGCDALV